MIRKVNIEEIDKNVWTILTLGCGNQTEQQIINECKRDKYSDYLYTYNNGSYRVYVRYTEKYPELCTDGKLDKEKYNKHQQGFCMNLINWMEMADNV